MSWRSVCHHIQKDQDPETAEVRLAVFNELIVRFAHAIRTLESSQLSSIEISFDPSNEEEKKQFPDIMQYLESRKSAGDESLPPSVFSLFLEWLRWIDTSLTSSVTLLQSKFGLRVDLPINIIRQLQATE